MVVRSKLFTALGQLALVALSVSCGRAQRQDALPLFEVDGTAAKSGARLRIARWFPTTVLRSTWRPLWSWVMQGLGIRLIVRRLRTRRTVAVPLVFASFYACGRATEDAPAAESGGNTAVGGSLASSGAGGAGSHQAGSGDAQGGASGAPGGAGNAGGVLGSSGGQHMGGARAGAGGASGSEATAGAHSGGDGSLDGAGGAGGAENGGAGGEAPANWQECSTIIRAGESVQRAIESATAPAILCVEAGVYRENLTLRGDVSLIGTPDTVLCGVVDASATGQSGGTSLSFLQVYGQVLATGRPRLTLRNMSVNTGYRSACAARQPAVKFAHVDGGAAALTAIDVRIGSPGFDVSVDPGGTLIATDIRITGSRCEETQCYAFLSFHLGNVEVEEGSSVRLQVANNLIKNMVLEAIAIELSPQVTPEIAQSFTIQLLHNTIASSGDPNTAINFRAPPTVPVVIANNVIAYTKKGVINEGTLTTLVQNSFADHQASKGWFTDFDGGNYVPSAGSPLIGAGTADYTTPVDINGTPRGERIDVGAFQGLP